MAMVVVATGGVTPAGATPYAACPTPGFRTMPPSLSWNLDQS